MHFTIFYAWQSDRPEKLNKYFIRDAVEAAIKNIRADADIDLAPSLDHDTKGVPGIPDIPATICDKIDRCGIFLADMTFSGTSEPRDPSTRTKHLPNPNVLIELGYALARIGPSRIIHVMNTAFGPPEELPFDIKVRRHPICYHIEDHKAPDRTQIQRMLASTLEEAIKTMITSGVLAKADEPRSTARLARIEETRKHFEGLVSAGRFHGLLPKLGMVGLSVIPFDDLSPRSNPSELRASFRAFPITAAGYNHQFTGRSLILEDSTASRLDPRTVLELTDTGILHTACSGFFTHPRPGSDPGISGTIPSVAFEREVIKALTNYVGPLRQLGVISDLYVGVSLMNVQNTMLGASHGLFHGRPRMYTGSHMQPDFVLVRKDTLAVDLQQAATILRPAFDFIWREYGYEQSLCYDPRGVWIGSGS